MLIKRHSLKRVRFQDWVEENGLEIKVVERRDGFLVTLEGGNDELTRAVAEHTIYAGVRQSLEDGISNLINWMNSKQWLYDPINKRVPTAYCFPIPKQYVIIKAPCFLPYQPDENDVIEEVDG